MDAGLEGTRRDWAIAALAMVMIGVAVAVVLALSPGPVEAHIAGLVPREAARADDAGVFQVLVQRTPEGPSAPLGKDDVLHPGDTLRFRAVPRASSYVGVVRIAGDGVVTLAAPTKGRLVRVENAADKTLDDALVLDSETGVQRFVALFCKRSMGTDRMLEAAREALERAEGNVEAVGELEVQCAQQVVVATSVAR